MREWLITHAPDDAFYYLQLADGKTSWFETNGYQPLWAVTIWLLGIPLSGDALMYGATALYFGIWAVMPFLIRRWFQTWAGFAVWLIPAVWSANIMMELAVATLVIFAAYRYRTPALNALCFYARLDLAPLAAMLTKPSRWWMLALFVSPWLVWNLAVFGTIAPDSLSNAENAFSAQSLSFAFVNLHVMYVLPLILLGVWGCWRRHKILLAQFAFNLLVDAVRDSFFMWHYPVLIPIIVFGLHEAYHWRVDWRKGLAYALGLAGAGIAVIGIAAIFVSGSLSWPWQTAMDYQVSEPVGAFNSGILGFVNEHKVTNLDGVFNHQVVYTPIIIDFDEYIADYGLLGTYDLARPIATTQAGLYGIWESSPLTVND